jgi:hypothetical protein
MELASSYSFRVLGSAHVHLPGWLSVHLQWPLPLLISLGSVGGYAALVRKPPTPPVSREAAKSHHVQLCIYSAVTAIACACYLALTPAEHTFTGFACTPPPAWFRVMSLVFAASKVWEWRDTIILRGHKSLHEIGFLHLFHHATTALVAFTGLNFPGSEKASYINAGVHVIMYYHFAYKLPLCMRPLITLVQITQFAVLITLHVYTIGLPCNQGRGGALEAYLPLIIVGIYMVYFVRFFYHAYVVVSKKSV